MQRRLLLTCAAAIACGRPLTSRAQRAAIPTIGYLANASPAGFANFVAAFQRGLGEVRYVEGRTVAIECRWTEGHNERLPSLAADLVRRRVSVIMATGGRAPALAAKAATSTIPIVFTGGIDPVALGLVKTLAQPGTNATGVLNISVTLTSKRLETLRELVPTAAVVAVLFNSANPDGVAQVKEISDTARGVGQAIELVSATGEQEFDAALAAAVQKRAGALFVTADPLFTTKRQELIAAVTRRGIPAIYPFRDLTAAGGLMSYGANLPEVHRQAGVYAGRILKGAKPAELPVLQPTTFDFVINARTARNLGIVVPATLLISAEVIE